MSKQYKFIQEKVERLVATSRKDIQAVTVALGSTGLVYLICHLVSPEFLRSIHFTVFFIPITITAWFGGFLPALLATLLSFFFVLLEVRIPFETYELERLVIFCFQALFFCFVISQLRKVSAELNIAKNLAEEASRAKSSFLANMSHEIRTPLGIIAGFAKLALEEIKDNEEVVSYLRTIERNSEILSKIINQVLDMTKIETGAFTVESAPVKIAELLQDVVDSFQVIAQAKNLQITLEMNNLPAEIYSDPLRIRQVLTNLISNAIKFTEYGRITIAARSTNKDTILIFVKDTGIGIGPEQKKALFKSFSQADASISRRFGGTGLGLKISRDLARALGGDLELLTSTLGSGSIFVFSIIPNLKGLPITATLDSNESKPKLNGKRILYVEDSVDNRALVSKLLAKTGAEVITAENGLAGIQKCKETICDIILMDLQMPLMDGHEAARLLRANGFRKPIIALTAHVLKATEEDYGTFDGYLSKPIEPIKFMQTLSHFS